ncbi:MAG: DNA-primase RepB domain-containing protein [Acidithiobacillus sp.]
MTPHLKHTRQAVERQLSAMQCPVYRIGRKNEVSGQVRHQTMTSEALMAAISTLARANAQGEHVWIMPHSPEGLVLVDDVKRKTIERMKRDGLAPCCVIETSPRNFQAWVRLTYQPVTPALLKAAARLLATRYEGDLASAASSHYGRLAGFTNRKEKHRQASGLYPYVLCREATGNRARLGETLIFAAGEAEVKQPARQKMVSAYYEAAPLEAQKRFYQVWTRGYRRTRDASRADFTASLDALRLGLPPDAVQLLLRTLSPDLDERKRGHVEDYLQRTIVAAKEACISVS